MPDQLDPGNIFFDPAVQMVLQKDGVNTATAVPILGANTVNYTTMQQPSAVSANAPTSLTRVGVQLPMVNSNSIVPATPASTPTQDPNQECHVSSFFLFQRTYENFWPGNLFIDYIIRLI